MQTVRLKQRLDGSREVRIPVPAEIQEGDYFEVEVVFREAMSPEAWQAEWRRRLQAAQKALEDDPIELPDDPPPAPIDFD